MEFKILNHRTENTGGGTMVAFASVYLPEENRTVFASTNETGMTVCTLPWYYTDAIEDYSPYVIHWLDFDNCAISDPWFDLSRQLLNMFIRDTSPMDLPYLMLADEIRNKVSESYRVWCDEDERLIRTDGRDVIMHPDYLTKPISPRYSDIDLSRAVATLSIFRSAYDELIEELSDENTPLVEAIHGAQAFKDGLLSLNIPEQTGGAIKAMASMLMN